MLGALVIEREQIPLPTCRCPGVPLEEAGNVFLDSGPIVAICGAFLHREVSTMNRTPFGLDGIPAGDPGFTVAIEVDRPLATLPADQRVLLLDAASERSPHLDRSALGNARVVVEVAQCSWWESSGIALTIARDCEKEWTVLGVEICRSDLWATEPFFDHEPGGLGELSERRDHDPGSYSTVILEVEPQSTASNRRRCAVESLLTDTRHYESRLSQSTTGRPQLVVDFRGDASQCAQYIAKPAHGISNGWSITRIRSVRSDVYNSEVSGRQFSLDFEAVATPQLPDWRYVSTGEGERMVVVTDPTADLEGWSVDITLVDGDMKSCPFYLDSIWMNVDGTPNIVGQGTVVSAWSASVESGSQVVGFVTSGGDELPVDRWDDTSRWLVDSLFAKPFGLIIELGPRDHVTDDLDDDDVVCAQIVVLDGGVFMLRRSRTVLGHLLLADYSPEGLCLDKWHFDDHFDDCTHGYLFSRDSWLIADACSIWFRDNAAVGSTGELGCSYRFPDELPRLP